MTRYQFGISALFSQTSFGGEPVVVSPNVGCFLRLVDGSTTRADQFPGARTYNIEVVIDFRKVVVEQFSFERRNGWLLSNSNWWMINLVPRGLSYPPYGARERETLENAGHVAPEQNYFWGRSPLSHIFLSGLFASFTQWSQQQDRFANSTTTITETKGNFCLNNTIR